MKAVLLSPVLFLVVLVASASDDKKSPDETAKSTPPKLPLGKDTTFVTGPLDKDGFIDYEAALNSEMSRGITPEKNANVLLIQAFGPAPEGGNGLTPEFFRWLDAPRPPKDGDYIISLGTLARDRLALNDQQLEAIYEFQSRATQRPWAAKDYTPLAEWLKANEKPLAVALEATKRPQYFNPLCSGRKPGEPSNLIGSLLPSVQKCRELASLFAVRAMLRLQEGKDDEAWADVMACHRLGRMVGRGATLIESLVGIAIGQIASNSTLAYLDNAKLTPKQIRERLKELQDLPPYPSLADKIALGERLMGLDALQNIRRGGNGEKYVLSELFGEERRLTAEERKALAKIDWTPAMRTMNTWYSRMATAIRIEDRSAREKEFEKIDQELLAFRKKSADIEDRLKILKEPGKTVSQDIGDVLMALLMPAVRKVQTAHERAEQTSRNLQIAFAMAAHRAENGRYPAKLDELAPKYLAAVPNDLFSGKALIYKPSEKGYLFYSIGPNGKDDGGRWFDDDPPGDDPRVQMPLPALKK